MPAVSKYFLLLFMLAFSTGVSAQLMEEDTTTHQPFFKAKKFNSKCYVGLEAVATQMLKTKAGMNTGISLNWVINHKYVISAKYYALSSPLNIEPTVVPDQPQANISLKHQFAGLGFSYILFNNKMFSFQPEISAGWSNISYTYLTNTYHKNFGEIIPAVYGVYNCTKYFRLGAGLNYRATIGASLNGLKDSQISGVSGVIFIRVGTF